MHLQLWWVSNTTHDRAFSLRSYRLNIIRCKTHSDYVKGSLHKKLSSLKLSQYKLKQSRSTTLFLAIPIQQFLLDRDLALVHYTYGIDIPNIIPKNNNVTFNVSMNNRPKQHYFISTSCFQHLNCNCDNSSFFKVAVRGFRPFIK